MAHLVHSSNICAGTGRLGNKKTSGDHPHYCNVEIGKNTEKSPGDLSHSDCCKNSERSTNNNDDIYYY